MNFYECEHFHLLLVEDCKSARLAYRAMIEHMGLNVSVTEAEDGAAAIREMTSRDFGCVILDYELPDMTANYILARVQEGPTLKTPVIVLTQHTDKNLDLELLEAGASSFLSKADCTPQLLKKTILYALVRKRYHESQANYENALTQIQHQAKTEALVNKEKEQLHEANKKLGYLSLHDGLTKLPNREMFLEHLNRAHKLAKRNASRLAVLFVDLDKFKNVNDSLGHDVGDQLLLSVVHRIRKLIRDSDIFARLGGDEFVLLIDRMGNAQQMEGVAKKIAQKIVREIAKPFLLDGEEVYVSASVGIDTLNSAGKSPQLLVKNAHRAMYQAKENGRNGLVVFSALKLHNGPSELTLTQKLHSALKHNEFELYYQPKIDIHSHQVVGAEALIRWQDQQWKDQSGAIMPGVFIPVAEDSDLILDIGELVLEQACRQISLWSDSMFNSLIISVNVSSRQFTKNKIVEACLSCIDKHNIAPERLELEVTERTVLENAKTNRADFDLLRELGISISIDDFGTGFSSLSCLQKFPFDIIKIDASFIAELSTSKSSTAIVSSIINMTQQLGLHVIAEGVETRTQLDLLKQMECDQVQGYYFSQPLAVAAFEQWVENYQQLLASKQKVPFIDAA